MVDFRLYWLFRLVCLVIENHFSYLLLSMILKFSLSVTSLRNYSYSSKFPWAGKSSCSSCSPRLSRTGETSCSVTIFCSQKKVYTTFLEELICSFIFFLYIFSRLLTSWEIYLFKYSWRVHINMNITRQEWTPIFRSTSQWLLLKILLNRYKCTLFSLSFS